MSEYAVVNPATGETRRGVPGDLRRRTSKPRSPAPTGPPRVVADDVGRRARRAGAEGRRAAHRAPRGARRDHRARDGQADGPGARRGRLLRAIYDYYADSAEELLADEPITCSAGEGTALVRRSSIGPLLGIMPWNFPYYQVARFAGPNLVVGNTILLKPAPQCPESAAAMQKMLRRRRLPGRRLQDDLRHERPDRRRDRRPARPGRLADRLRARRRRGRRDRRPQPEEGRARARRLRPVHPARRPTTSTRRSRPPSRRGSTTPASRATPRSGSSSSTSCTTSSSRSSRPR